MAANQPFPSNHSTNATLCLRKLTEILAGLQPLNRRAGEATTYDIALPWGEDRFSAPSIINNEPVKTGTGATAHVATRAARTLGDILDQITNPSTEFPSLKTIVNKIRLGDRRSGSDTTMLWEPPVQVVTPASQRRTKYSPPERDSLRNIAKRKLGDERFECLLLTINRAEVVSTSGEGEVAHFINAGQTIWLPTEQELAVHRRHFFPKSSLSERVSVKSEVKTPLLGISKPTKVESTASRIATATGPDSSPLAPILYRVRFAGDRNSIDLKEIANHTQTDLLNKMSAIATEAGSSTAVTSASRTITPEQHLELEAMMSVERLSSCCRLLSADRNAYVFSIKLQTEIDNRWRTIASYECLHGKTVRRTQKVGGGCNLLEVQLPPEVARQMSKEDFHRNWKFYYGRFMSEQNRATAQQVPSSTDPSYFGP